MHNTLFIGLDANGSPLYHTIKVNDLVSVEIINWGHETFRIVDAREGEVLLTHNEAPDFWDHIFMDTNMWVAVDRLCPKHS